MLFKSRARAVVPALAIAAVLAVAVGAQAAKVTGGTTTLKLSSAAKAALAQTNIKLSPLAPGTVSNGALVLPITRGHVNKKLQGRLFHAGGFRITKGKRSAPVRHLVINSTKRGAYLLAVVKVPKKIAKKIRHIRKNHKHAKVAVAHRGRIVALRIAKLVNPVKSSDGKSLTVTAKATKLLAVVFNRLAGKHIVSAGQTIGTVTIAPKLGS